MNNSKPKLWMAIYQEEDERGVAHLVARDGEGKEWGRSKRTPPADPSKDENFSHELVTDAKGLLRMAMVMKLREDHSQSRLKKNPH